MFGEELQGLARTQLKEENTIFALAEDFGPKRY